MANTKLVLKESATDFKKDLGAKTTVKDVIKLSKDHEGAEIVIEEETPKEDVFKPLNIKVVQLTGVGKKKAEPSATSLSGVVISLDMPSTWAKELKYEVRLYDKSAKTFAKEAALVNIQIDNGANADYELTKCDSKLAYYYYENAMSITEKLYKENKLVQVRRYNEDEKKWSEWGTEIHTDITVGGKISIFKTEVELSYKTGDENVGLKPGQEITIKYSNILEEDFAKNFPKRIFEDKPETSLMGMAVKLAKLNYNTRTKNFQLGVQVNTNDIDVDLKDPKSILKYYKEVFNKSEATSVPAADEAAIKSLKTNGIQLLPGFNIKEVYFEMNTNDDSPVVK